MDAIGRVELAVSCGWLVTVCWLLFHAFNQSKQFRHVSLASREPNGQAEKVAIVVPARNESFNIRRCVESLLGQRYPRTLLRVIVVDDHSADDTAAIVRSIAEREPALALLVSPPLPPSWVGKSHACWIGTRAISSDTDWICFVDADVWGEPDLIASAVECARATASTCCRLRPDTRSGASPSG